MPELDFVGYISLLHNIKYISYWYTLVGYNLFVKFTRNIQFFLNDDINLIVETNFAIFCIARGQNLGKKHEVSYIL